MGRTGEREESSVCIFGLSNRGSGGATDPNRIGQGPGVAVFLSDYLTLLKILTWKEK